MLPQQIHWIIWGVLLFNICCVVEVYLVLVQFWFKCFAFFYLVGFIVHVICFPFSTSFTCWRSKAFFSVVTKSLAVVISEWIWYVYFDFSYCISYFYFGRGFRSIEAENICICLDRFVIFLHVDSSGVRNTLFVNVGFISSRVQRERSRFLTTPFDKFSEL